MTVERLIQLLQAVTNKERVVVLQRDPEGNGYALAVDGVDENAVFDGEDECGREVITDDLRARGFTDEDLGDGVPAIVLWPER